jgi:hypothetical protein
MLLLSGLAAKALYVSREGDDGGDGLGEHTALASLGRAVELAGSGDKILLRRGDIFRESAAVGSGVSLDAYGDPNAPLPVISGSVRIVDWQRHDGPIWKASLDSAPGYLFVDNDLMRIARYPNTGWLRTTSWSEDDDGANTVITTGSLAVHPRNAAGYWNGATCRWHRHSWWFETRRVTAYTAAGELSLDGRSIIPITPYDMNGWGFYLDGKLAELDTAGEWFFDSAARSVYLWAPDGADPNERLVEVAVREEGVRVAHATVRNICFRHQTKKGLIISRQTAVEHCLFEGIGGEDGGHALQAGWHAHHSTVSHCLFRNNLNVAIGWNEDPGTPASSVIEYDTLINTGTVPGYGGSGPWHAAGIIVSNGTGVTIRSCRIDGTGYAGIILGSDGNTAEYNILTDAMATLNDGAGIYTNCSNSTIRHNIIRDVRGGMESSGPWANLAHGIWPEFLGDFRDNRITGNTCAACGGFGLFLPNNFSSVIDSNVFFDNTRAQMELSGRESNGSTGRTENLPQNNTFRHNVFCAAADSQGTILFRPEYDYGSMTDNYFVNPYRDSVILAWGTGTRKWSRSWMDIAGWQQAYTWADHSPRTTPIRRAADAPEGDPRGSLVLLTNDSPARTAVPVDDNGVYVTLDGDTVTGSLELPPFTSAVLQHSGGTSAVGDRVVAGRRHAGGVSVRWSREGVVIEGLVLSRHSPVHIRIHRLDGRLVDTFIFRSLAAGRQESLVIPTNLAPGAYVCRIRAGGMDRARSRFVTAR